MKLFIVGLFLISSSLFAQEVTRVNADIRCEKNGAGITLKTSSKPRIWQTESGEDMGLELKVKTFTAARCPGCYSFTAILMDRIQVRGTISSMKIKYEMLNESESGWESILNNVKCVPAKK